MAVADRDTICPLRNGNEGRETNAPDAGLAAFVLLDTLGRAGLAGADDPPGVPVSMGGCEWCSAPQATRVQRAQPSGGSRANALGLSDPRCVISDGDTADLAY